MQDIFTSMQPNLHLINKLGKYNLYYDLERLNHDPEEPANRIYAQNSKKTATVLSSELF